MEYRTLPFIRLWFYLSNRLFEILFLPNLNSSAFFGQASMQIPQEKQSGRTISLFKIDLIAGHGDFEIHISQSLHLFLSTFIRKMLTYSSNHVRSPTGHIR